MKTKIQLLLVALLMGVTVSVSAQTKQAPAKLPPTPEQIAQKETEKMTKELSLTSDQQTKVQAINLKYAQERSQAIAAKKTEGKQLTDQERTQLKADAKKSFDAQDAEIKTVLTADQYKKFAKDKDEFKQKMHSKVSTASMKQ